MAGPCGRGLPTDLHLQKLVLCTSTPPSRLSVAWLWHSFATGQWCPCRSLARTLGLERESRLVMSVVPAWATPSSLWGHLLCQVVGCRVAAPTYTESAQLVSRVAAPWRVACPCECPAPTRLRQPLARCAHPFRALAGTHQGGDGPSMPLGCLRVLSFWGLWVPLACVQQGICPAAGSSRALRAALWGQLPTLPIWPTAHSPSRALGRGFRF